MIIAILKTIIRLSINNKYMAETGEIVMTVDTLSYWLNNADWQYIKRPISKLITSSYLTKTVAIIVGKVYIFHHIYQTLKVGDVLLPQQTKFDCQGKGTLHIGHNLITVQWLQCQNYQITNIEHTNMTQEHSSELTSANIENIEQISHSSEPASSVEPLAKDELPQTVLNELELIFNIEIGSITLTLEQLQNLSIGSIVTVSDSPPGQATLRHRNRLIGRGELVNVEGRVGLQILSLELNHGD